MAVDRSRQTYSFEFFPPRTADAETRLATARDRLAELKPDFFSVTYGAGGSTREKTLDTVLAIRDRTGIEGVPHISCIGSTRDQLREILGQYQDADIRRLVALRGDLPSGTTGTGDLRYANELVEFIRAETGDRFVIEVAAYPEVHPQARSAAFDLDNLRKKAAAGANSAITQYFFNVDAYFRFVDRCRDAGIDIPIVPGIMPITNYTQLQRFSDACGAEIPRWMRERLRDFGDDRTAIREFGIDVVSDLCRRLLEGGAPGLHFYSMNQHEACTSIWHNLRIPTD